MENQKFQNDSINIKEIFSILWAKKFLIVLISVISFVSSIIYSLSLPDLYKSTSVLSSTKTSGSNLGAVASQYSGLANMVGISIPSAASADEVDEGIKIMQSLDFFENFVKKYELLYELEAVSGWDKSSNKLINNSSMYDLNLNKWISNKKFSINGKPSYQSAHRNFLKNFSIARDRNSGFVVLSFSHFSPNFAKKILELIVEELNQSFKEQDILVSNAAIELLEKEVSKTSQAETKEILFNIIQSQFEKITIAKATPDYLLKTLSAPMAPELKNEPSRSIIVILATFLTFTIACFYFLVIHFIFKNKTD